MMIAIPIFFCSSCISSKICAWIVTSSAVVGSSAIRISGSQASAMAIITRWRIPPDNSCGYCFRRFSGSLTPTKVSISIARSLACSLLRSVWSRIASISWFPMVNTGFKLVIGSWKIMEHFFPRNPCICFLFHLVISSPLYNTSPLTIFPVSARICIMEYAVTLFPEPLSPTIPSVFPASRLKETPFTAFTSPESVKNDVCKSFTCNKYSLTVHASLISSASDLMHHEVRHLTG